MSAVLIADRLAELSGKNLKHLSADLKCAIKDRDGHRCRDCGAAPGYLEVHHVTPRYLGGTHDAENLLSLCFACHAARHRHRPRRPTGDKAEKTSKKR